MSEVASNSLQRECQSVDEKKLLQMVELERPLFVDRANLQSSTRISCRPVGTLPRIRLHVNWRLPLTCSRVKFAIALL
jgi:hypothetical protein